MKSRNREKGFTLIELLVVIAVIGILAAVILASLNGARVKARNSERMQELKQLQVALELYYADNNSYPIATGWRGVCGSFGSYPTSGATGYIPNLAPTYISVLPTDPKPLEPSACYIYLSLDGVNYKILAYNTVEGGNTPSTSVFYDPARGGAIYTVYTSGGVNW